MSKIVERTLKDILTVRRLQKDGYLKKKISVRMMVPHLRILIQFATPKSENSDKRKQAHLRNQISTKAGIDRGYSEISEFLHASNTPTYSPKEVVKAAISLSETIIGKRATRKIVDQYKNSGRVSLLDCLPSGYKTSTNSSEQTFH